MAEQWIQNAESFERKDSARSRSTDSRLEPAGDFAATGIG